MMQLQIGTNPVIMCDHIHTHFTDMTEKEQNKGFLYLNPNEIKCVSVYLEGEDKEGGQHR